MNQCSIQAACIYSSLPGRLLAHTCKYTFWFVTSPVIGCWKSYHTPYWLSVEACWKLA